MHLSKNPSPRGDVQSVYSTILYLNLYALCLSYSYVFILLCFRSYIHSLVGLAIDHNDLVFAILSFDSEPEYGAAFTI